MNKLQATIDRLHDAIQEDYKNMPTGMSYTPQDFKNAFLAISKEQGEALSEMIIDKRIKNVVEFGTSFGFSTLFLAKGILATDGHVTTTELIQSKADKAIKSFKDAEVDHVIDVRVGDAMETLKDYNQSIDLLLLDGWKDLYLPLFMMVEPLFHKETIVYVDNADFDDVQAFLKIIGRKPNYNIEWQFGGKVAIVTIQ